MLQHHRLGCFLHLNTHKFCSKIMTHLAQLFKRANIITIRINYIILIISINRISIIAIIIMNILIISFVFHNFRRTQNPTFMTISHTLITHTVTTIIQFIPITDLFILRERYTFIRVINFLLKHTYSIGFLMIKIGFIEKLMMMVTGSMAITVDCLSAF